MSCKTVCRICLKVDGSGYAQLQSTERSETLSLTSLSLKKKISMYLPELDLNVRLTNPLVMCTNCVKSIQDFHIFKMKYKDTERILRNYIVSYPANCLSEPLDLAKVAQSLDSLAYNESSLLESNFQSPHDIKPTIITSHSNGDKETAFRSFQQYSDLPHLAKDKCHDTYNELFNIEVCDVKLESIEKEVPEKANITKTLASIDRRNYPSKYYCKTCNRLFNSQNHYTKHNCGIIYSGTELKFPSSGFLCLLCNKTASSKDKLRIHFYRNHKKKSRHKCKACFKSFRDNYYLAIHMRVHTGERPYECEICHKSFTSSYTYSRHCKSTHSIKGVYKCSICSQTFRSKANLRQHECKHRLFECDICFEEFLGINVLKSHRTKKHNISDFPVKEFTCLDCQKTFATKEYLAKHSCIHNGEKYECDVCTKRFTTRAYLKVHVRVHSEEQPYQCDICGKTFGDKGVLERHILTHSDDKPYVCDLCPKQYTNKSSLTSHKFSHSEGYTVKCFVCSKQVNKGHLKIHLRIHTGEKPFECEVCLKRFVTARALRRHMVVHTKEKQFKCDICYKLYSTIDTLKIHQRIHTVGKPFQCDICGSFFSEKNSVKRHRERKHNNLRFECEVCLIKFPTKREWKTHKLLHDPYECDVCKKQFPSIQRFNAHKKIHSDDKPHKCDICQKLFRHMIHLQKHKRVLPEGKSRVCKVCKVKFEYSCESNTHKKCLVGN